MRERGVCIGNGIWVAMVLVLSACAPALRAQSEPAAEASLDPGVEPRLESTPAIAHEQVSADTPAASAPAALPAVATPAPVRDEHPSEAVARSAPAQVANQVPTPAVAPIANSTAAEFWTLERGVGKMRLLVPRSESLVFEVHLNLGWLGSPTVGKVTMSSDVRPYYPVTPDQAPGEQVLITGRAEGSYKVYTLDNTISSALLPQEWPRIVHRNVQTGSENRSREVLLGVVDGKDQSRYRGDMHCRGCKDKAHFVGGTWPWSDNEHCKKCKRAEHRVWKEPRTRDVPAGTFDMLTAVYMARSLVVDGRERVEFPLIDRNDLWQVQLTRGRTKQIETAAGKFNAVQVELRSGPPEGTAPDEATKFEGLFGIHGTISIWMEAASGVPVQIEGSIPAGPIDIDVRIDLHSARGTPSSFTSLRD